MNEPESHAKTLLRDRYLELTNRTLPELAKQRSFPVKYNHCFQRIILDHLFGGCWYEVLDRKQGPAYKQLTIEQLQQAIAIAEMMIEQPDDYIRQLNQNSLQWRGKRSFD
jgi:hypothetical protein